MFFTGFIYFERMLNLIMRHSPRVIVLLTLTMMVSACGTAVIKELAREFKRFENRGTDQSLPPPNPAVYCYSTLATVTCYDTPQPEDEATRLVGTTVQPIDPKINEDKIKGDGKMIPPMMDVPEMNVKDDSQPNNSNDRIAEPPQSQDSKPDAVKVLIPDNKPMEGSSQHKQDQDIIEPANKPLYDPYLNQLEQKPADNIPIIKPVEKPKVELREEKPIVKPKKKKATPKKDAVVK